MKFKHNKKRNTALLYEYLVKELTRAVLKEDVSTREKIILILKEFYSRNSTLAKELSIYKSIAGPASASKPLAEKILAESKRQFERLSKDDIFKEQTKLIKEINSFFDQNIFSNFVPNYKSLATIYQLFNLDVSPKQKIILEERVLDMMVQEQEERILEVPVHDNLVLKKFIERFNNKYSDSLMKEQKELLSHYIASSFEENSLEFKSYINEELGRIKKILVTIEEKAEFQDKTKKVYEAIMEFKNNKLDADSVKRILHLQQLVNEIKIDDN